MSTGKTRTMDEAFFEEYTSHDAILKYTRATAGYGIGYLLDHDYKDVYLDALKSLPPEVTRRGIRMLEFGCGGGMNLLHLVSILRQGGVKIEKAMGTDFSPVLIDAAKSESGNYLRPEEQGNIAFHVANNDSLIRDIAAATHVPREQILGSFDFILGVNTMRYSHRAHREIDCAQDIMDMLIPGGICVNIDMSDRFPAYRSTFRNFFHHRDKEESYLPSLEQYVAPFQKVGFRILRKEPFCWIPHSSGQFMCGVLRAMTPVLNSVARSRAMRSLVVAQKPVSAA